MKRICLFLILICIIISCCGCSSKASQADVDGILADFFAALRVYDREEMSRYLTEFPDSTAYANSDDIFNDSSYSELYRSLYNDITYAVTNYEKNSVALKITMPNIQALYQTTCKKVENLANDNAALKNKLEENDVIFIQEMMRDLAAEHTPQMTQEFTLELDINEQNVRIVCDDELRALVTGNFFLAKNIVRTED